MSHKATSWAWSTKLPSTQKLLLLALADMADEEQSCYPGQALLSEMVGVTVRSIRDNLDALEQGGFFERERRHRSNGSRTSDRFSLRVGHVPEDSSSGSLVQDLPEDSAGLPEAGRRSYRRHGSGERNHQGNHQIEPPVESPDARASERIEYAFAIVWQLWPSARRGPSKKAASSFRTAVKAMGGVARLDDLVDSVQRFCEAWAQWPLSEQKYVPLLSTWLNQERWTTPVPEPRRNGPAVTPAERARSVIEMGMAMDARAAQSGQRAVGS